MVLSHPFVAVVLFFLPWVVLPSSSSSFLLLLPSSFLGGGFCSRKPTIFLIIITRTNIEILFYLYCFFLVGFFKVIIVFISLLYFLSGEGGQTHNPKNIHLTKQL